MEIGGILPPASAFKVVNICDRAELKISDCLAPFATCAVIVEPAHFTESWVGMFTSGGWGVSAGVPNSYGRWFDEVLVEINLPGKYWIIEVSYPFAERRCAPQSAASSEISESRTHASLANHSCVTSQYGQ